MQERGEAPEGREGPELREDSTHRGRFGPSRPLFHGAREKEKPGEAGAELEYQGQGPRQRNHDPPGAESDGDDEEDRPEGRLPDPVENRDRDHRPEPPRSCDDEGRDGRHREKEAEHVKEVDRQVALSLADEHSGHIRREEEEESRGDRRHDEHGKERDGEAGAEVRDSFERDPAGDHPHQAGVGAEEGDRRQDREQAGGDEELARSSCAEGARDENRHGEAEHSAHDRPDDVQQAAPRKDGEVAVRVGLTGPISHRRVRPLTRR